MARSSLAQDWFPNDKGGQEQFVTRLFVSAIERQESQRFEVEKLSEADHDALLTSDRTEIDLQLMEIVIRPKRGSPYRSSPRVYNAGRFADHVISAVGRKLYAKSPRPIWLWLYSTHWAFVPSVHVLHVLNHYFTQNQHVYERVFVMELLDNKVADVPTFFLLSRGKRSMRFRSRGMCKKRERWIFEVAVPAAGFDAPSAARARAHG